MKRLAFLASLLSGTAFAARKRTKDECPVCHTATPAFNAQSLQLYWIPPHDGITTRKRLVCCPTCFNAYFAEAPVNISGAYYGPPHSGIAPDIRIPTVEASK